MTPHSDLITWYCQQFIPPDARHYATMQPRGVKNKYLRRNEPPTAELVARALTGPAPLSLAVTPMTSDGQARAATLDTDQGGHPAVARVLTVAAELGLWAFAQLGENADGHSGGHVYIPSTAPLPAPMLKALAESIQARAGVTGECWPYNSDLRLPLMPHMRTPNGPRRLPLLLQTGELVDTSDAWQALARLRDVCRPNAPDLLTRLTATLAPPSPKQPAKLHKSKVNPFKGDSVIGWYNSNYGLAEVLRTAGATLPDRRAGVIICPFHDDKSPSLGFWTLEDKGRLVCRCLSEHSNCPLANGKHFDAFDLFCHLEGLTLAEGVKRLVKDHGLGQRRTFQVTTTAPEPVQANEPPRTLESHTALIEAKRDELARVLQDAATRYGAVTVVKATPGMGKTEAAAALVRVLQSPRRIAIVAPSKEHAAAEWLPRLADSDPFIWRARHDICTCYPSGVVEELERRGYAVECMSEDCPYKQQLAERAGRIAIYQYPHLILNGGRLMSDYDLVIVDESPLAALLSERTATPGELRKLARRMPAGDPGRPLALALGQVADTRPTGKDLSGPDLLTALAEYIGDVAQAIRAAQTSDLATMHPVAPKNIDDPARLPRQFWGRLLQALSHDATDKGNALVTWGKTGNTYAYAWYDPAPMLARSHGRLPGHQPAIIVLDGTAHPVVSKRLYAPWPVEFVELSAPLSPAVRLVQDPHGPSTRRAFEEAKRVDYAARALAVISNELDLPGYDGLISYKTTAPLLAERLGIAPDRALWYGGQRGKNTLQDARALAVVASPTVPPNVVERRTRALWRDDSPIRTDERGEYWIPRGTGDYQGIDPRLEAVAQVHGPAELVQAIHRARPLLASEPSTVIAVTPWNLTALGLPPDLMINERPHGNSDRAGVALATYQARVTSANKPVGGGLPVGGKLTPRNPEIQYGIRNRGDYFYSRIENPDLAKPVGAELSPPPLSALAGEVTRAPSPSAEALEWARLIMETAQQQGIGLCVQADRVTCDRPHYGLEQAIADGPPDLAAALRWRYRKRAARLGDAA